ncbi:MAG: hypothetical protein COX77_00855 [Candidatus Komeilibacteria bacterium CG_4_10_14_0_2_um_filter_37_10]|uniref:Uncharacterized protein n=1 Tax=Candidatus Komeilibacteria bacterium CG_4_10_14_0_2_um_filter_37_10 TaxID=1974470 RepID=A0A2M7VGA6_9BACT|nr:MAG: hypothetical protein COX77_00855 [Candidatus Komeilibacteria bacterium CG_4_10_14_0_2_um_filter_37_10]PJA93688.1 MAG: hypothetical protein CO133_01050 [Candidatus Komeilibacteria bacterium CG_4_9_14_3_um_filter_37_5]
MDNKIINPVEKISRPVPLKEKNKLTSKEIKTEQSSVQQTKVEQPVIDISNAPTITVPLAQTKVPDEQLLEQIENILAEDLGDFYQHLDPQQKTQFRQKGEETAKQISSVLSRTKIKISQVIKLITSWLKLVPGFNKFFIEQSAKIKADKILVSSGHADHKD